MYNRYVSAEEKKILWSKVGDFIFNWISDDTIYSLILMMLKCRKKTVDNRFRRFFECSKVEIHMILIIINVIYKYTHLCFKFQCLTDNFEIDFIVADGRRSRSISISFDSFVNNFRFQR